jgi:diaminohydroxyphosphoribosylaminopyrimidine deaminase/5-amino-6-(5-phosphoribosylamino)uracil reductase
VVSSRAALPSGARLFDDSPGPPVWVACTARAGEREIARLTRMGVEIIMCEEDEGRVSLSRLLRELAERGINSLLLEGGERLLGAFFDAGFVDRVAAFVAPKVIGGARAKSPVGGRGVAHPADAKNLVEVRRRSLGDDVMVEGYLTDVDDFFVGLRRVGGIAA